MTISSASILTGLKGSAFTTYRIGGPLEEAYQPASEHGLLEILQKNPLDDQPLSVLGWGGNTLIASQGIQGVTLILRKLDWVQQESATTFVFGAGTHLAKVSSVALKHCLTGGEYMIGIPGTVGGAVRMNAGALGQDTAGVIQAVRLYDRDSGEVQEWSLPQLDFHYRKSAIDPQKHIILSARMTFQPGDAAVIGSRMEESVKFRKTHHPKEPNGGSVFKNPAPDKPMGRLMEEMGAKGQWREGGVMISPLHGNFIVNVSDGSSTDVLRLMHRMKQAVAEVYGLDTHPENLFAGRATDEEIGLWQSLNKPAHI